MGIYKAYLGFGTKKKDKNKKVFLYLSCINNFFSSINSAHIKIQDFKVDGALDVYGI